MDVVWIVTRDTEDYFGGVEVLAVFSTKDKADAWIGFQDLGHITGLTAFSLPLDPSTT